MAHVTQPYYMQNTPLLPSTPSNHLCCPPPTCKEWSHHCPLTHAPPVIHVTQSYHMQDTSLLPSTSSTQMQRIESPLPIALSPVIHVTQPYHMQDSLLLPHLPLPIPPVNSKFEELPWTEINKGKLANIPIVLRRYSALRTECKIGN